MSGHIVQTMQEPSWRSIDEYVKHIKRNEPHAVNRADFLEYDYHCTCCGQGGPFSTGALLKCEDLTPTTVNVDGKQGRQLWLCADCYHHGVRPKYFRFGSITWNKEGRKIRKKAEDRGNHPW